jgi:hypothetical protein
LLSIQERVMKAFPEGVDLYTSDAGADVGENYNAQEQLLSVVHMGQVTLGLMITKKGGNMLIKQFTFFHPFSCSLLYLLSLLFRQVTLLKPESSARRNSEIYVLCRGYKEGCRRFQASSLCQMMLQLLHQCDTQHKQPIDLPEPLVWGMHKEFARALVDAGSRLVALQSDALDVFHTFATELQTHKGSRHLSSVFRTMAREVTRSFTKRYAIAPLHPTFRFSRLHDA